MRLIDADTLVEILTTAIRNMQGVAKFIGAEDDPEIKMEIKAYTDILGGVKEQPTIEPEQKKGKWIIKDNPRTGWYRVTCSECEEDVASQIPMIGFFPNAKALWNFCPNCGSYNGGDRP